MNNKSNLFFDLDGTLVDSQKGIFYSVDYSLERMGLPALDDRTKRNFIGPPLGVSYKKYCGVSDEQVLICYKYYREAYSVKGLYMSELYEGTKQTLAALAARGKRLYVATSKPENFAVSILKYLGADRYFIDICGADLNHKRDEKAQVLQYALEKNGITEPKSAVLIGDRKYDAQGARQLGIDCIGVLHGFGSRDELESAGACPVVENLPALLDLFE